MSSQSNETVAAASSPASVDSAADSTLGGGGRTTPDENVIRFAPPTVSGELGRLGKYRIQKELGRGGMGAVYLAFDERLQRKVALKVMLPKAAANATAKDRFLREARAAAKISSDHVVGIYEADEIDGTPFISLQYLQGYPLDEYLKKKGPPSIPQTVRIARDVALGLVAAHKIGLVHRDIKPGNIWLEAPNGRVKILDLGLAKPVAGSEQAELTGSGIAVGTPAFMSPEQGLGKPVDGRSDLFSLGCVLYRLVTGKMPFEGTTLLAIFDAINNHEPTPVRQLNPDVPEPLADLIRRLMAKKPADRPASAKDVAEELARIAQPQKPASQGTLNVTVAPPVYTPLVVTLPPNPFADLDVTEPDELATPPKKPRKFPAVLVGGLFAGLLAVASIGFIIIKITNKDGSVTELKVPDDAKVEVNGKTVTPEPKKPEVKPAAQVSQQVADPDRAAAERVLALGGDVRINIDQRLIPNAASLPREAFELKSINLAIPEWWKEPTKFNDTDMGLLKDCTHLLHANLNGTQVTDAGLANLKDCKNLQILYLLGTKVSDAGLAHLKDNKNFAHIHLDSASITDVGIAYLKDSKNISQLLLSNSKVSNDGLAHFKDCKKLTLLNLWNTKVSDTGLRHFKDCKELHQLILDGTEVTDAGMAQFLDCKNLVVLGLKKTKVTAQCIDEFKKALPKCRIESDFGIIEPK